VVDLLGAGDDVEASDGLALLGRVAAPPAAS
jgi:hypothetical protein